MNHIIRFQKPLLIAIAFAAMSHSLEIKNKPSNQYKYLAFSRDSSNLAFSSSIHSMKDVDVASLSALKEQINSLNGVLRKINTAIERDQAAKKAFTREYSESLFATYKDIIKSYYSSKEKENEYLLGSIREKAIINIIDPSQYGEFTDAVAILKSKVDKKAKRSLLFKSIEDGINSLKKIANDDVVASFVPASTIIGNILTGVEFINDGWFGGFSKEETKKIGDMLNLLNQMQVAISNLDTYLNEKNDLGKTYESCSASLEQILKSLETGGTKNYTDSILSKKVGGGAQKKFEDAVFEEYIKQIKDSTGAIDPNLALLKRTINSSSLEIFRGAEKQEGLFFAKRVSVAGLNNKKLIENIEKYNDAIKRQQSDFSKTK